MVGLSNRVEPNWGSQTGSPSRMTLQLQKPPPRPPAPKTKPGPMKPSKPVAPPKKSVMSTPSKSSIKSTTKPTASSAASTSKPATTKLQSNTEQSEPPKKEGFSLFVAHSEFPTWDD